MEECVDVWESMVQLSGRVGKHGSIVRTCGKAWVNCQDVWESMGQLSALDCGCGSSWISQPLYSPHQEDRTEGEEERRSKDEI